jgi:PTS system mannose-specific IIC component
MTAVQIILLVLWAGIIQVDQMTLGILPSNTIITGIFAGFVMGNPTLGLIVGATLQSYALGLGYFGGSSIPNYQVAAIIVIALCGGNMDNVPETISLIGIPVAALTVQLDVVGRLINSFFAHKVNAELKNGNLPSAKKWHLCGISTWSLTRLIPVLICLLIGPGLVEKLLAVIPAQISSGLKIAAGIFPAIGFSILLKYMNIKGNIQYLIIGFVLSAYFKTSTITVAVIGLAIALFVMSLDNEQTTQVVEEQGGNYDE